ncbi:unnamed protein product [Echinostoma caproni]|uniref:SCP domain-containing protein n=1 Tax=Echinostoma caproni TaxID=27848 RepID=A0A183AUQ0_9TREM|nr:unnamed protein product [Echinostoma caproni]
MGVHLSLTFLVVFSLVVCVMSKCCCSEDEKTTPTRHQTKTTKPSKTQWITPIPSGSKGKWDRNEFLEEHNRYRNMISTGTETSQPRAANLPKLIWDTGLERKAYEMSLRCYFKHETTGENLYVHTSKDADPVKPWFDEQSAYRYTPISWSNLHVHGHYTQKSNMQFDQFKNEEFWEAVAELYVTM